MGSWCSKEKEAPEEKYSVQQQSAAEPPQTNKRHFLAESNYSSTFKEFPRVFEEGVQCLTAVHEHELLCGGEDQSIHHINWSTGEVVRSWRKAHLRDVNALTPLHTKVGLFFTAGRDKMVKSWKLDRSSPVGVFEGHALNVTSVTANPDGTRIVTGSRDNQVKLWDVERQFCLDTQDVKLNIVHFCRWIPSLDVIAQGGEDLTIRLWDARSRDSLALQHTLANFDYHPICCDVGDNDTTIFTGHNGFNSEGSMITHWDLRMLKQVQHFFGHAFTVRAVQVMKHHKSPLLISGSDDSTVKLWDTLENKCIGTVAIPEGRVTSISETPQGELLIGCRSGVIVVCTILADNSVLRLRYIGSPEG